MLPATILRHLQASYGDPAGVELLGGMSRGRVYRVRWARRSLILKRTPHATEAYFYQVIVPAWLELQQFTPILVEAVEENGQWWLMLEDIPQRLPQERRQADPDLLATLGRLHHSALPVLPEALAPYRPAWTMAMTEHALAALPAADAALLAPILAALCQAAQPLFASRCPLSGDPNPANWGLREDGRLVLYDWERYCRGTPALDLAISIPGLGDMDAFRQVAARYVAVMSGSALVEQGALARQIAHAKVWSVIEFLGNNAARGQRTVGTVNWVAQQLARWVRQLAQDLALP